MFKCVAYYILLQFLCLRFLLFILLLFELHAQFILFKYNWHILFVD